jgi:O-antigen/teichoic acid export membrane protein
MADVGLDTQPSEPAKQLADLSPLSILRHSSKLSGASIAAVLVLFPVNIVVARVLGPNLLGVFGLVTLWQFYASLIRPAVFGAAYREMPGLLGEGRVDEAVRLQNIGITVESAYVIACALVMVLAGATQYTLLRNSLWVAAAAFLLMQLQYYVFSVHWAHRRFNVIAAGKLVGTLTQAGFMLSAVWLLGIYALILAPGVAALTSSIASRVWTGPIGFRPRLEWAEAWRLIGIGLPLALGTIFYWGFRSVDRTIVAAGLPILALGYFTFVMQFVNMGISLVSDFGNVVQPALWAKLGQVADPRGLGRELRRLSIVVLATTCVGIGLTQAMFGAFVHWFVPAFAGSVATFEVLVVLLACATAGIIPSHLLNSSVLNRQNLATAIYGAGIPINVALGVLAVHLGWGLIGVAWASVIAQSLVSAALLASVRGHLNVAGSSVGTFYLQMAGLLCATLALFAVLQLLPWPATGSSVALSLLGRLAIVLGVWGGILGVQRMRLIFAPK